MCEVRDVSEVGAAVAVLESVVGDVEGVMVVLMREYELGEVGRYRANLQRVAVRMAQVMDTLGGMVRE